MKAWTWDRYGPPEVLKLRDVPEPEVAPDEVLVRVRAASVNPYDWRFLRADPFLARTQTGLLRPKAGTILGADLAGVVAEVGADVEGLRVGDEVFGEVPMGAFAEAVAVSPSRLAAKPAALSFAQAAAVSMAGQTALQGLRDEGRIEAGQRVLVNGAAGGIGTFAVQIAKALGARVTGVCSARSVELVRSLGADDVVDYTSEDFTARPERYDLVLDIVGNRAFREFRGVLTPRGALVLIGGIAVRNPLLGPMSQIFRGALVNRFVPQRIAAVSWKPNTADLEFLASLAETGRLTPAIERTHPFAELPDALRHVERRHAQGKTVITL
ncbi:NAD(P)-dependent alcohol dehydrogenase [Actinocorallia aurea]